MCGVWGVQALEGDVERLKMRREGEKGEECEVPWTTDLYMHPKSGSINIRVFLHPIVMF